MGFGQLVRALPEATMSSYFTLRCRDLRVHYRPELDGGGFTFGRQFLEAVQTHVGAVDHVFELCAGPAFIGFSLLAHGLCRRLTVADCNPAAVEAVHETIRVNGLSSTVRAYVSDGLDQIPASEKWDLVVGNPPHFEDPAVHGSDLRVLDERFELHARFYRDVRRFLAPGARVLLQENHRGSEPERFRPMIEAGGLRLARSFEVDSRRRAESAFVRRARHFGAHVTAPAFGLLARSPRARKLVEDNDVFRALQRRELFDPRAAYYFVLSEPV